MDQTVLRGGTATFSVVASSGTTISYQWYFNGYKITNAIASTYTVTNAQPVNIGLYSVAVQNAGGVVNSREAALSIFSNPPLDNDDSYSTLQNTPLTVPAPGILANDLDVDGDTLTAVLVSNVTHGTLSMNANGSFTYVPALNYNGSDCFTYSATDGLTTGNVATVTISFGYNVLYVDTTSDTVDGSTLSVATLLENKGADGKISLREAILAANNTANGPGGPDCIYFAIADQFVDGSHTINLTSALPPITDSVVIDGTTDSYFQDYMPVIELNGAGAGAGVNGLTIFANGSTVRGLAINRFSGNGLVLNGNSNNVEISCFGTGVDGDSPLGNGQAGILITGRNNTVGSAAYDQYNVIGANSGPGLQLTGASASGNVLIRNLIGVSPDGLSLLPNSHGVRIENGASTNRVGGTGGGEPNRIVANTGDGISVVGATSTANALLGNVIYANGGLAIDLNDDGVTLNDLGDSDTGPNGRQNFPVLLSASVNGSSLSVTGSLNSVATSVYRIEFFRVSTSQADASNGGEAESFLGKVNVTTDASGNAAFGASISGVVVAAGDRITATATPVFGAVSHGGTSEFSQNIAATFVGTPGFAISALAPTALGNEFLVNTTTNADQLVYYWSVRTVGVAPDGSFIQVWIDKGGADGNKSGIFGQRFDANGSKVGGEFQVNTTISSDQDNVSMAVDKNGNFIVTWDSASDIFAQRFLANGTRLGGQFLVNTSTLGPQKYPEVDFAGDGSFIVAWTGPNSSGTGGNATILQRFDVNGNKVGAEILANIFNGKDQILDSLSVRDDGSFVVTWGNAGDVYGRVFDASGAAVSAAFRINSTTADVQQYSIARCDAAGNFVVVWESSSQDGSGNGIFGRRFAVNGAPLTGEFALTTQTAGDQFGPVLAMDRFGNFVVAWSDGNALDGSAESVWLQRFDASGLRIGTAQRVNQTTAGYQAWPVIAMNRNGRLVVAWEGNGAGDTYGVFARRYQINPVVTEGATTTFTVALTTAPTAPVTLVLSVSDSTEASLSTNSLTFTPANWSLPQTVTITGVQDLAIDGDVSLTIYTGAATSSDPLYNGLNPDDVPMLTLDSGLTNITVPPTISNPPQGHTIVIGQNTSFSVTATGTAPLSYQWSRNGSPLLGATNSTLILNCVQSADAGSYSVVVANPAGSCPSAAAMLTVLNPPSTLSVSGPTGWSPIGFTFQVSLPVGCTYVILASTNCQDWTPIATNVALTANVIFTDAAAATCPKRFYRALVR